jgi:predicted MFS family arabinose efflux permease
VLLAQDAGSTPFLGDDLLAWLLLAMGGALFVGNVLALTRNRDEHPEGELARAPVARTAVMAVLGLLAGLWALATLLRG